MLMVRMAHQFTNLMSKNRKLTIIVRRSAHHRVVS
jgi:hypothetical protein